MFTKLLNKLGKWDETMAFAVFAEVGDFSMMEKALANEMRILLNSSKKCEIRKLHKLSSSPARG